MTPPTPINDSGRAGESKSFVTHALVGLLGLGVPIACGRTSLDVEERTRDGGAGGVSAVVGGAEVVVLQANQLAETLDPLEVSRVLSAIAWQADQVEQKLVGGDEH